MIDTAEPVAQGRLNTNSHSQVSVPYQAAVCYYRPDSNEVLVVPLRDAAAFENHGVAMCKLVDNLHQARSEIAGLLAAYRDAAPAGDPGLLSSIKAKYLKAHKIADAALVSVPSSATAELVTGKAGNGGRS